MTTAPPGWRSRLVDIYVVGWAGGAAISSLALLVRNDDLAAGAQWPASSWQREIGLWNLILISFIAQALVLRNRQTKLAIARSGIVASLLLGGNHLLTLLGADGGPIRLHVLALAANTLNLGAAVTVLLVERGGTSLRSRRRHR
jgi:hypothetical protein